MAVQRKPDARDAPGMTRFELAAKQKRAGLTTAELGQRLGMSERRINEMLAGTAPIRYLIAYAVRHL